MTYKLMCDHCNGIIERNQELVKIEVQFDNQCFSKHYHLNCFNYKFSTDIKRIKDGEEQ